MKLRAILACVVCRTTHGILRMMKKGATALPGKLALLLCPDVLTLAAKDVKTLAVTGTNGKTTSCRMLRQMLINDETSPMCNGEGANLRHGIATAFIMNLRLSGKPKRKVAVIECDEATVRTVLPEIKPKVLLVTNLFRDQEDRYGSVAAAFDAIYDGVVKSPDTMLCVNSDSPYAALFNEKAGDRCSFFGMSFGSGKSPDSGESGKCTLCGGELKYRSLSYANLGDYVCKCCGVSRPRPDICGEEYYETVGLKLCTGEKSFWMKPSASGLHNAYNALGAILAARTFGVSEMAAVGGAEAFEGGFGRMEHFPLGSKGTEMILVKNAAAMNRTFAYLEGIHCRKTLVFIQNASAGDGRELSWLRDVAFEGIDRRLNVGRIIIAGEAKAALAQRLKAAGLDFKVAKGIKELVNELKEETQSIYLLPSYTAMTKLRHELVKSLGVKEFWE